MGTFDELRIALARGVLDDALASLHDDTARPVSSQRERALRLAGVFAGRFGIGADDARLFSAPGRSEIGGNHTDHQNGRVLAAAVDMDVLAIAAPNGTNTVRLASEGFPPAEIALTGLEPDPAEYGRFTALVRGVFAETAAAGYPVSGLDIAVTSDIPAGSGLSSSAAFEVLLATVTNDFFCDGALAPVDVARLARRAENEYFGKPCGLMDQLACVAGGIMTIDFSPKTTPAIAVLDVDFSSWDHTLCIVDSGANHADLTDAYRAIPDEMAAVAAALGCRTLGEADRDEFFAAISHIRDMVGDRAVQRAVHFFAENDRVRAEAAALVDGDFSLFLELVRESGNSSQMYLQNIRLDGDGREQALSLALCLCDAFLCGRGAVRVHGGGFAGTAQAFVPHDMLRGFVREIEAAFGPGRCHIAGIRRQGAFRLA